MAALTWREVSAPNFSNAIDAQRLAGDSLNSGFNAATKALESYDDTQKDATRGELLARMASYGNDYERLSADLQNGTMFNGLDRGYVSADELNFGIGREGTVLGNDQTRVQTKGFELNNEQTRARTQGVHMQNAEMGRSHTRARDQEAAMGQANNIISQLTQLARGGTPEGQQKALDLFNSSMPVLNAAGYTSEYIQTLADGIYDRAHTGAASQDAWDQRNLDAEAQARAKWAEDFNIFNAQTLVDAEQARQEIMDNIYMPPEDKEAALAALDRDKDILYGEGAPLAEEDITPEYRDTLSTIGEATKQTQAVADTIQLDSMQSDQSLIAAIRAAANDTRTMSDVTVDFQERLAGDTSLSSSVISHKLKEFIDEFGMAPSVAEAILLNSMNTNPWISAWFRGSNKLDHPKIAETVARFYNKDGETAQERLQPGLDLFNNIQTQQKINEDAQHWQTEVDKANTRYQSALRRKSTGRPTDVQAALLTLNTLIAKQKAFLEAAGSDPSLTTNTSTNLGR